MQPTTRRDFIKTSTLGTAGITIGAMGFSAKSYAAIAGANERINVAVIGIRNQGTVHLNSLCGLKDSHNVQIKTLCDTDEQLFAPALKLVEQKAGWKPATTWDLRPVLDDKEIDAVTIVVPNHWHALATIWACQAGKHVYVEKPASHNLIEGRRMVEAARKYQRVVQVGTQRRSGSHFQSAAELVRSGKLGKVPYVRTWIAGARKSI